MEENQVLAQNNALVPELYFLIVKFLSKSPFEETYKVLKDELEKFKIFPKRLDWTGQEHEQSLVELEQKYPNIGPDHLLEVCGRLSPLLDKELIPSVPGLMSLLGAGRQSLLRTKETISMPRTLIDYCTRKNQTPLSDVINRNNNHNIVNVIFARECAGPLVRRQAIPPSFYSKQELLRRTLGHLSAVYCVLFDRTGNYIITGADDLLVKLWNAMDGRLLTTFRGASAEITDIAVNLENTMLAAGSVDHILRVWDLQTASVIAVLSGHNGTITSVNFCPSPKSDLKYTKYLVTTSNDGSVAFWSYVTPKGSKPLFHSKPTQYHEKLRPGQAQMICASFSPGGVFLAAGSADHHVRVYKMGDDGPKRILEIESHTDTVDSIQWAHSGLRFVSGSKDGTALVWHFESSQWKFQKLMMSDRLPTCPSPDEENKKLKVTMVSWDFSDQWIVTAVNDHTIKVWNAQTCKLHKVLRGHTDELYVLESHPKDNHILLSAGHDGQLFIWDIYKGESIATFLNQIDGQGHGGIFDAKWSPDGTMIAATDSHGHILMFGFGAGHERLKMLPKELFFHTDYRPLIRDSNYYVLDEQTQLAPHLMPPPFLVDVDGNPYPPSMQRLVPGRENCPSEQLIPNIGVGMDGFEVDQARSEIDRLIEALANRQNVAQPDQPDNGQINSPRGGSRSMRRYGDVEGVRQSVGNWQRDTGFKFIRRMYVRPMVPARLQALKQQVFAAGLQEADLYRKEIRKRPLMINTGNPGSSSMVGPPKPRGRGRKRRPEENQPSSAGPSGRTSSRIINQPTTSHRHTDDEEIEESSSSESSNSDDSTELELSNTSSSDTESSEYSDWVAMEDQRQTLQPPKRSKRRPVERDIYSPESSNRGKKKGARARRIPKIVNGEIPDEYKPPEWLSETVPKKQPYYPQMGDEIVYFRQGHERYLDWVETRKLYNLTGNNEPWTQLELRDHEFCKVIGIKYEIRPPRLCCLKLALMTESGILTDQSFTIKYHDIPDVLDFLVLKQTFDTAVGRNWGPGDRFRSMIDDKWWIGEIESHQPLSRDFPDSLFMCFKVRWDNSEYEFMSPWDLEPIDEDRLPSNIGGGVPVLPVEIQELLYRPKAEEWPRGDRDGSCRRIVAGLEEVMGLAIADAFLTPVDLNAYPMYAFLIEYPIDLSTIKARFENHFYRRITSAQFDVRYLATNAEKFNEPHSNIVKSARIITDLCLRILRDYNEVDVPAVYHQLQDTYMSSESEDENQPGTSYGGTSSRANGSRRSRRLLPETDWRVQCRELLHMIWESPDSEPFREPVDTLEHPDYLQIVETPMDLLTIREEIRGNNYETPLDFAKDMRLIFQNSRNYNTNKRSRIYAMTLRLSTLFETHIKILISNWKSSKRRGDGSSQSPKKRGRPTRNNGAGPSRRLNDEDDDDEDDDFHNGPSRGAGRRTRMPNASNRVTSSNMREPQPGPSRRSGRLILSQNEDSSGSSGSSSESSSGDTEDSGIPLAELGRIGQYERKYKMRRKIARQNRKNAVTSSSKTPRNGRKSAKKRKRKRSDRENENTAAIHSDEENCDNLSDSSNPKTGRPRRKIRKRDSNQEQEEQEADSEQPTSHDEGHLGRRSKKHRRYESDQSFHVEEPKAKRKVLDSDDDDSDEENPRPTRESARRAFVKWSKADSDEDEEDDDGDNGTNVAQKSQVSSQSQRRARKKRISSDEENESQKEEKSAGSSTSRNAGSTRTQKMTRQRASQSQSQDSDADENGPSTSTNSKSRINGHSSSSNAYSQRSTRSRDAAGDNPTHHLRSHEEDHNYGEPSYRTSRRAAHNAREDSEEHPEDPLNLRRSKREHKTVVQRSSSSNQSTITVVENRRVTRNRTQHDYYEEEEIDVVTVPKETQKRVKTIPPQPDPSDDDDDYSEDDNTPLKMMASGSKNQTNNRHNTRNGNVNKVKRTIFSDDENDPNSNPGPSGTTRSTRRSKRPHYNEDSDEEKRSTNDNDTIGKRLKRRVVSSSPVHQDHDSDNDSSENEAGFSVSSRGRVRKITAKARGLFKE